jgi:hypothetical protein
MKRKYLVIILVLPLFMGYCHKSNRQDHSLSIKEYQELGVPDHSIPWNFQDYLTTFGVLKNLKIEEPFALPVKESQKSNALFYRMISLENLGFLQDESLPLHEKAQRIKGYLGVFEDLADLYTNMLMKEQYYNPELVEIWIFGLNVTEKMVELAEQINESELPDDQKLARGYYMIREIYQLVVLDILKHQQYTSQFVESDLELLTDILFAGVQRNLEWIDEETSQKIKQALQTVIDSTSSRNIRNNYLELLEIL